MIAKPNVANSVRLILLVLTVAVAAPWTWSWGADERSEAERLAPKYSALAEQVLEDGTRVDQPAVLLLLKDPAKEWRHLTRAAYVCGHLGITFYVEGVE